VVVIPGDVGVEAAKPEPLEQMRLPEIADVVIDCAGLGPGGDRPDIAGQHHQKAEAAVDRQEFHHGTACADAVKQIDNS